MMPVFCSWLVRFGVKAVRGLQKRFAGIFVAMSLSVKAYGKASRGSRCSPVKMSKLCRGYPLGTGSLHWLSLFSSSFGKVLSVEFTKAVFIISTQLQTVPGASPLSFRRGFNQIALFHLQHVLGQGIWKHWTSGLSMGSTPSRCFRAALNRDLRAWVPHGACEGPFPPHWPVNGHRDRTQPCLTPSISQALDPAGEFGIWEYKADGAWVCRSSFKKRPSEFGYFYEQVFLSHPLPEMGETNAWFRALIISWTSQNHHRSEFPWSPVNHFAGPSALKTFSIY